MASLLYNSFVDDLARGAIDADADTFKVMLVTSTYAPNKDTHTKRSDVTNEVTGTGYTAGGTASAATITKNTATDQVTIAFASVNWPTSTITARAAVIYKSRGGASSADELVAYVDFLSDITSTADTFTVTFSSPITFQS
jgi:hypothetical protein